MPGTGETSEQAALLAPPGGGKGYQGVGVGGAGGAGSGGYRGPGVVDLQASSARYAPVSVSVPVCVLV